jgi:hypothetical protein
MEEFNTLEVVLAEAMSEETIYKAMLQADTV